jgi:hypothetical protein
MHYTTLFQYPGVLAGFIDWIAPLFDKNEHLTNEKL